MDKLLPNLLRLFGLGFLLVGLVAAYYGPLEIYVFYLFANGGRFHYDGFGMGSFWFAALVVHNLGYYAVAAAFIPLGVGHLKLRRWALTLTQLSLWFWIGIGILLSGNFIMLIPAALALARAQPVLLTRGAIIGVAAVLSLLVLPILAMRFYRSEQIRLVFVQYDTNQYWTERYPFPLLAVLLLFVIMILGLHIAIFFQSLFPFFGSILLGRPAVYLVALCILLLGILIYGTVQLKPWAWWGSVVYVSVLSVSTAWSFSRYRVYDIILMLKLPAYEMAFLGKLPLVQEVYLVGLLTPPLLMALALIVYSRRYFGYGGNRSVTQEDAAHL